jgi:hypothetical protein
MNNNLVNNFIFFEYKDFKIKSFLTYYLILYKKYQFYLAFYT